MKLYGVLLALTFTLLSLLSFEAKKLQISVFRHNTRRKQKAGEHKKDNLKNYNKKKSLRNLNYLLT